MIFGDFGDTFNPGGPIASLLKATNGPFKNTDSAAPSKLPLPAGATDVATWVTGFGPEVDVFYFGQGGPSAATAYANSVHNGDFHDPGHTAFYTGSWVLEFDQPLDTTNQTEASRKDGLANAWLAFLANPQVQAAATASMSASGGGIAHASMFGGSAMKDALLVGGAVLAIGGALYFLTKPKKAVEA